MTSEIDKVVREVLSKRDPLGYYVVVALNTSEVRNIVEKFKRYGNLLLEEIGNTIIIRGKSRRIMEDLIRTLIIRGLLRM